MKFSSGKNVRTIAEGSLEAIVFRCNCDNGPLHPGIECPNPLIIPYGTVAYHHKNWWNMWLYHIVRFFNKTATFWRGK